MNRVVVVSDCTDVAFAEMRGAMLTHGAGDYSIEPLVPSAAFSLENSSFVTRLMVDAYPPGTVICVVVNAIAERTERIVGRLREKDIVFEGTNTGQFGWILEDFGLKECYELHDPGFLPFGGKYVHAPAVGRIAAGTRLDTHGTPFDPTRIRSWLPSQGDLVHVDNFGNGKFRWSTEGWEFGDEIEVRVGGQSLTAVYWQRMMARDTGEWVVYPGSSLNLREVGEVRGYGLHQFGVGAGDTIALVNNRLT